MLPERTNRKPGQGMLYLLILLLAAATPLRAAEDLTIAISEEFGGYYRPGAWYPIVVSIQNQPTDGRPGDRSLDFRGRLIVQSQSKRSRFGAYEFVREVEVPAFSTQRFTVFVKFPEDNAINPNLEVRTDGGRLITTIPIKVQPLGKDQMLMVTVSEEMTRVQYPMPRSSAINAVTRANMPVRNLPEHWASYDSADILVFPSWPQGQLSDNRLGALRDWVTMGGTLIFLGGANSNSYGGAAGLGLLPVETSSSKRYKIDESSGSLVQAEDSEDLSGQKSLLISNADLLPGSEVVFGSGEGGRDMPILARKQLGRGQVVFSGVDFESIPNEVRQYILPYWLALLPAPNVLGWEYHLHEIRDRIRTVKRGTASPPNLFLIILICVLYTALVGPANFFYLAKTNRIQWAWLSVPVIVFVFSGLIYSIGTLTKGGETVTREVTMMWGVENQPLFEERSFVGAFTHRAGEYRVEPDDGIVTAADSDRWHEIERIYAGSFLDMPSGAAGNLGFGSNTPVIGNEDDRISVQNWPLRTFDSTVFEVRGPRQLDGALEAGLSYYNTRGELWLDGTIANRTGFDFYESAIFLGNRGLVMGSLNSGQNARVDRDKTLRPFVISQRGGSSGKWQRLGAAIQEMTGGNDAESAAGINRENARQILENIFEPPYSGRTLPPLNGKCLFVGLAEAPETTVSTNLRPKEESRSIVVFVELNPVPVLPEFIVPSQLVQVRLQNYSENQTVFPHNKANQVLEMSEEDQAVFSIQLPFHSPNLVVTQIDSRVNQLSNQSIYDLFVRPYDLWSGSFGNLEGGAPLRNGEQNMFVTPYSGMGWILFQSLRPEDDKDRRSFGSPTELDQIEFEVRGAVL